MGMAKFGHHPDDGEWTPADGTVPLLNESLQVAHKTKVTISYEIPLIEHIEALYLEYTRDSERVDHRVMWALFLKAMDDVREAKKHNV